MDDDDRPFADVLAAAVALAELPDVARAEAWASSALGVWAEDPDAAAFDDEFVDWLVTVGAGGDDRGATAHLVLAAVTSLLGREVQARVDGQEMAGASPPWLEHLGTATTTRAWLVARHDIESFGIGFVSSDHSEHSLLADLVDGSLTSLVIAPGPDELFDGSEDLIAPEAVEIIDAANRIVAAWRSTVTRPGDIPESIYVNGAIGRARLRGLVDQPLDDLRPGPIASHDDTAPAIDVAERAELDRWAMAVLDGAVGAVPGTDEAAGPRTIGAVVEAAVEALLDALVEDRIALQPAVEREAYGALEWADWLGIVIELVRRGAGADVTPDGLVDAINRCPEVTSSIPRSDRSYYVWVFTHLVALLRRAGVIDGDGHLTDVGSAALPVAVRRAWSPGPDS